MTFDERKRLIERSYDAWGRRDLQTLFAIYHPDCEWDNRRLGLPDVPAVCRGHAEMAEFNRVTAGTLPIQPVARSISDLEDERILVAGAWEPRGEDEGGRATLLASVAPFAQIVEFEDGLISRVEFFASPEDARKAAASP